MNDERNFWFTVLATSFLAISIVLVGLFSGCEGKPKKSYVDLGNQKTNGAGGSVQTQTCYQGDKKTGTRKKPVGKVQSN